MIWSNFLHMLQCKSPIAASHYGEPLTTKFVVQVVPEGCGESLLVQFMLFIRTVFDVVDKGD